MFLLAVETAVTEATTKSDKAGAISLTAMEQLELSLGEAYKKFLDGAPKVLTMIAILVIGYIIARLVARLIAIISQKTGLQAAAEQSGLANSMRHMGIRRDVPAIMGTIAFWLCMCTFVMAGFAVLDMPELSAAMKKIVDYIPNLLVATVVVVVGLLAATFVRGVVATSADRIGITYAERLASGCYYMLAGFTFYAAFEQLKFQLPLLENLILIGFGGLSVGLALALGLGGRDVMTGILAGYYVRQRLQAGDSVTIGSMEGTVREVGPVATIIETHEGGLVNRHSVPNVKVLNEGVR